MPWLQEAAPTCNRDFRAAYSAVVSDRPQASSIYSWDLFFLNDGAFLSLAKPLQQLHITRIYQELPQAYLELEQTADMVERFHAIGIETVFLTGDRAWSRDGLDEFYAQIDALCRFNTSLCTKQPITTVALDVESYTLRQWERDPEGSFSDYTALMAQAYDYAHERGFQVVQIIPPTLDTISQQTFERFVASCCDEISVMNYEKDIALSSIWNEVRTCRSYGVPIETIFETMPKNDYYSVTESNTYFYDGFEALSQAKEDMTSVYGTSLGISYHFYQTLLPIYTGTYLAEIYPYTTQTDPNADSNGQVNQIQAILLSGDDGSKLRAQLYSPHLNASPSELCFLAVGVKPSVRYSVMLISQDYRIVYGHQLTFDFSGGRTLDTAAIGVCPTG